MTTRTRWVVSLIVGTAFTLGAVAALGPPRYWWVPPLAEVLVCAVLYMGLGLLS